MSEHFGYGNEQMEVDWINVKVENASIEIPAHGSMLKAHQNFPSLPEISIKILLLGIGQLELEKNYQILGPTNLLLMANEIEITRDSDTLKLEIEKVKYFDSSNDNQSWFFQGHGYWSGQLDFFLPGMEVTEFDEVIQGVYRVEDEGMFELNSFELYKKRWAKHRQEKPELYLTEACRQFDRINNAPSNFVDINWNSYLYSLM
jgi:hypothetical protein